MNILYTLCGRAGSKGMKNKNIKEFLGVPLVYYSLAAIKMSAMFLPKGSKWHAVLNTDSMELAKLIREQTDVDVDIIWREEGLGTDTVPKVSVIKDCYKRSRAQKEEEYDMVVDLDITSPLRTAEDVWKVIQLKRERPDTDVVYTVTSSRRNPYFNMVKEENGFFVKAIASCFTTRQQAPVFYDMNASVYAYSPLALQKKEDAVFFNDKAAAVMMRDTAVLDIDSEEDFELLKVIGTYFFEREDAFAQIKTCAEKIQASRNQ